MFASIRGYFYAALTVGLLLGGVTLCHHVENVGVKKEATKVEKVGVAAEVKVAVVDATAQSTETQSAIIYKQAVLIPDVGDIGLVCKHTGSSPLPAAVSVPGAPVREPVPDSSVGPTFDPSGPLLTRAAQADAQIAYLQRRVKELETQMENSP